MVLEFEKIVDEATTKLGTEHEQEIFVGETYVMFEQMEKHNHQMTLQQVISLVKQFEMSHNKRECDIDPTMLKIAMMGMKTGNEKPGTMMIPASQSLSRAERRLMERKGNRSATKKKRKR